MYEIVLYGNKKDQEIRRCLLPQLQRHFEVHYLSDRLTVYKNGKPRIILIETDLLRSLDVENGILVLKRHAKLGTLKHLHPTVRVILQSDQARTLLRALSTHPYVYTCGLSSKDYINFSSREENTAVVSLQRSLRQVNGSCCEPMELPCTPVGEKNEYTILATALVLMLLGVASHEKMLKFKPLITSHKERRPEQNSSANTNI